MRCFGTHRLTCSLASGFATGPRYALWRVCENKVICALDHCRVDAFRVHTSEGDSMFCLFALLCHGRANGPLGFCQQNCFSTKERNASLERFQLKSSKFQDKTSCAMCVGCFYAAGRTFLQTQARIYAPQARLYSTESCATGRISSQWNQTSSVSYWCIVINQVFRNWFIHYWSI